MGLCPRRMLADLVIGWLQEEVLLSMYARFAMQPAVIPDVTEAEQADEEDVADGAARRRRRLAASQQAGDTVLTAQEGSGAPGVSRTQVAVLRDDDSSQRQRHTFTIASSGRSSSGDPARRGGRGSGNGGKGRGRSDVARRLRLGWRYRRRKDAVEEEPRVGRQLSQLMDAASLHTAGGDDPPNPAWHQSSWAQNSKHRRRKGQHQQHQQLSQDLQARTGDSPGGGDRGEQLPDALYPEMPPPMFAQNAGADARR